jgi:hypothetical protein
MKVLHYALIWLHVHDEQVWENVTTVKKK